MNAFPTLKFSISPDQYLLNTIRKVSTDLFDHSRRFLAGDRFTFAQAAYQIFTALLDESQHRSIAFLPTVFGVVALTPALLVAEQGLHGCIDVYTNAVIVHVAQLPGTLAYQRHQVDQRIGLVGSYESHGQVAGFGCLLGMWAYNMLGFPLTRYTTLHLAAFSA